MKNTQVGSTCYESGWSRGWTHCAHASLAVVCVLLWMAVDCSSQPSAKNVLVIFSGAGQSIDLDLIERSVREHYSGQVNFYSSYVYGDNEEISEGEPYLASLAETFSRGYTKVKLDAVIVASSDALRFVIDYHDKVFPDAPVVFYGLSKDELAEMKLLPGMVGRTESTSVPATIELMFRLHPDAQAVAVIHDSYGYFWSAAHSELLRHQDRVKEIDIFGPPSVEEIRRIDALPPHTVALFQIAPETAVKRPIDAYDVLAETVKRVPTYSAFHTLCLDYGCVGGVYPDWNQNTAWAGEAAARILAGEKPVGVPVVEDSRFRAVVDWRQLRHWHIPESALPAGNVILYRQPTLWDRYGLYVVLAVLLVVAQTLLIAGLLWQRTRKRKAEAVLRESEESFRMLAETTPSLIWICDAQGNTTYVNERRFKYLGPDSNAGYGNTWTNYVHPDDASTASANFLTGLRTHRSYSSEYRLRGSDGVYRWVFNVASPRLNSDGSFAGFIGSIIDISDQKLAQEELRNLSGRLIHAQEVERRRIARELHDDICQRLAVLSLEIERANRNSNESGSDLEEIRKRCSEIAIDLQMLSHRLHSSKLEYLGLSSALKGFCIEFSKQHEARVDFKERDVPRFLPQDVSLAVFRVAQEALHNAMKYSQTAEFAVDLRCTPDEVRLEVSDRGVGFDVERARGRSGLGLLSMQERVHIVHGRLFVESKQGAGTKIVAVIPLAQADALPAKTEDDLLERVNG